MISVPLHLPVSASAAHEVPPPLVLIPVGDASLQPPASSDEEATAVGAVLGVVLATAVNDACMIVMVVGARAGQ